MSSSTPSLSSSSTSPPSFSPDLLFQSSQEVDQPKDEAILNGQTPQINHENLFETIAKLAGIDGSIEEGEEEEKGMEMKENEQQEGMQKSAEQQMQNGHKFVETPQQAAAGCSSSSSSSSSSRRKNGNPTRISSDGEGDERKTIIGRNEEAKLLKDEPKQGCCDGEEEESSQNEEQMDEGGEDGKSANRNVQSSINLTNNQQFGLQFPLSFPPFGGFNGFGQELLINDEQMQQQRRLYAQLLQQGQQQQNCSQAQMQQGQMLAMQRNLHRLTQTLKEEISAGIFGGSGTNIDKDPNRSQIFGADLSAATEAQAHAGRLLAALSLAARHHQWAAEQLGQFSQALAASPRTAQPPAFPPPTTFGRIFPSPTRLPTQNNQQQQPSNPFHTFLAQNPLMAAMAAAQQHFPTATGIPTTHSSNGTGGSGIFPPAIPNGFVPSRQFGPSQIQQHQEIGHRSESDGSPRKKRAKVTDSVRGPRSSLHPCREPANNNSSTSERSTPQGRAFPPTMAPLSGSQHLLFHHHNQQAERGGSPSGDDFEGGITINGGGEIVQPHRTQLTHVHLRKAKLMFFYQRYPNSALLKSYFPDIHFNKHNTAQLIKWFSNFREFFYMQMEKYAKQALAEGIRHRSEVVVTQESEIFKQLNIHYNKNSIFQPPERLQFVVQETLREFFSALQQKKDAEPSWKKAIYKIIQQLDEPIPEWFKHQEFVEMLERTT